MIALRMLDIEWFKMLRSGAFRMSMIFFSLFLLLGFGGEYYSATLKLPTRIDPALADAAQVVTSIAVLFMVVMIVLLTGNEKTWRTERQNVIDGLSRHQYFLGKLLLLGVCALLLWTMAGVFDIAITLVLRSMVDFESPLFTSAASGRFTQMLLFLLLIGSVGMMFATVASSSGAALALTLVTMLAQLPVIAKLSEWGGVWQQAAQFLPMRVLTLLGNTTNDAAELARANQGALEAGGWLTPSTNAVLVAAFIYIALFCAGAWLSLSRRDL